ncbi:hypothetical protein HDU79_010771 [Rhizoclosmatium sp. JEL0117]|nr:hypothetical protein HDU79_010771 [Rhizoclosmatium sp. JEL0117]
MTAMYPQDPYEQHFFYEQMPYPTAAPLNQETFYYEQYAPAAPLQQQPHPAYLPLDAEVLVPFELLQGSFSVSDEVFSHSPVHRFDHPTLDMHHNPHEVFPSFAPIQSHPQDYQQYADQSLYSNNPYTATHPIPSFDLSISPISTSPRCRSPPSPINTANSQCIPLSAIMGSTQELKREPISQHLSSTIPPHQSQMNQIQSPPQAFIDTRTHESYTDMYPAQPSNTYTTPPTTSSSAATAHHHQQPYPPRPQVRIVSPLSDHDDSETSSSTTHRRNRVGGTSKKRHTLDTSQSDILNQCFQSHRFLRPGQAKELSEQLGMTTTQVKIWFQNKRAYGKRKGYKRGGSNKHAHAHDDEDDGAYGSE